MGIDIAERPTPLRLIHIAVDIPQRLKADAGAFYERLRFKAIDDVGDVGLFTQSEGDTDHHNWFLSHRDDRVGINRLACEVQNFDYVITVGEHMVARGWTASRGIDRHALGSKVFRFVRAPFGGCLEFSADMDRMDKNFAPRVWERWSRHHM